MFKDSLQWNGLHLLQMKPCSFFPTANTGRVIRPGHLRIQPRIA